MFVDVHTHLDDSKFDDDRNIVIEHALQLGCKAIINNSTNLESLKKCLIIQKKFPICKTAAGLYPGEKDDQAFFEFITENIHSIIAIGEIGLDYYHTTDNKEQQKRLFQKQIDFAIKHNKPIIVHSRSAESDVIDMVTGTVILHCFCGKLSLTKTALKKGCYFSIPPRVIIDQQFQQLVQTIPLSRMLTETDAPYMGHIKGKRNEPANILKSIETIARIKGTDIKETQHILFANYKQVFM